MAYRTFGSLKDQVSKELDIEDEEFIQPNELVEYFNSAVRNIEAEIVKLGLREKYLQKEDFIDLVEGQADYSLPDDIIDTKIRKIIYRNGVTIYTLNPLKTEDGYEAEDVLNLYSTSEWYMYAIYKNTDEYTLRLVPHANQTVTQGLRIIYWKDLNRYTSDSVNCDVPDICYEYILSYVRLRVYMKETHVNTQAEKIYLDEALARVKDTLSGQTADPTIDLIDQDLSIYQEMS